LTWKIWRREAEMEATIKRAENGYMLELRIVGGPTEEYVFKDGNLKEVFEMIDRFFLGCGKPEQG